METNPTSEINPTPEFTQQQEHQIWQLRMQGWNQQRLAEAFGIDQSTVSRILKRVRSRLAAEFTQEVAEQRLEQTEQLVHIVTEALAAWEASKQPSAPPPPTEPQTPINDSPGIGGRGATSQTLETQTPPESGAGGRFGGQTGAPETKSKPKQGGNGSYLRIALQALLSLRAVWGLDAPNKAEIHTPTYGVKALIGVDIERFRNAVRPRDTANPAPDHRA